LIRGTDAASLGQETSKHPVLNAVVNLAQHNTGVVLTGRVGTALQSWWADHVVFGVVVVPAAALAEWVWHAGAQVGCPEIGELRFEQPLVLTANTVRQVQVHVAAPDEQGDRAVTVHSRADDEDSSWISHATGTLRSGERDVRAAGEREVPGRLRRQGLPTGRVRVRVALLRQFHEVSGQRFTSSSFGSPP